MSPSTMPIKSHLIAKRNVRFAVFAILFAVLSLSFGDAVIKMMSISLPLWQIYVIRSLIAIPVLVFLVKYYDPTLSLEPVSIKWTVLRSLLLGFMWIAYYAALPYIKLSSAAAVYYTTPIFITMFSALFTGEKIGLKSWLAIAVGFVGVLVIVRPDSESFNLYLLLPLLAAVLYALAMILTSTKCLNENPKVLSLVLNVTFVAMGGLATLSIMFWSPTEAVKAMNPFLLGDWTYLNSTGWLVMGVLAAIIILGSLFAAIAYQRGPPSIIATLDYSYLIFSALWGIIIFAETPDALTVFGMMLITGSGVIAIKK